MKKLITIFLLVLGMSFSSYSQTADYPWAIGAGIHWASFSDVSMKLSDQFKDMSWQAGVPDISVSRYLNRFLNVQLTTGYMGLAQTNHHDFAITDGHFWYADLDGQIKFLGGVIKEDAILTPYFYFGFGGQYLNQTGDLKAQAGLGLDLKVINNLSLYARADYATTTDRTGAAYVHPHVGIKYRFTTKKDMDKDGVFDEDDRCPDVFGLKELKGCPDRDGDGIADIDDKCPDVKGILALQGCPDKDGDGITDAEDRCPEVAGTAAMKGCPDRDKDGIADIDDNCPDIAGIAKFKGCPDTDGDGIMDKEDACPTVPGTVALKGCPDRDGDGIGDAEDKCPDVFGTIANKGCPEMTPVEKEQVIKIGKAIYFATGKDIIKKESEAPLDELVVILNKYPKIQLQVEGNTDNVGDDKKNLKLSQDRAAAVKKYLVNKGIAEDRLSAVGFGETKPIADNKTAAGRAQNRRVDLKAEY
jgi:OmpA-OmpF porin, OOP family